MADFKIGASYKDFPAVGKFSPSFELNMILYSQGLEYAMIDSAGESLVALEDFDLVQPARSPAEYCAGVREFFQRTEWAQKPYRRIRVAVDNPYSTLMPEVLYDDSRKKDYLGFNMSLPEDITVMAEPIEWMDSVFIYAFPACLEQLLRSSYPDTRPCHARFALLTNLHRYQQETREQDLLVLQFKRNEFDLAFFRGGRLMLTNTFLFATGEDVVYYTLFVMDQLTADPSSTMVRLAGSIEKDSDVYSLMSEYIRDIHVLEYERPYRFDSMLERVPLHRYYNLLHLGACE